MTRTFLLTLLLLGGWLAATSAHAQERRTLLFNDDWRFHKGDVAAGETTGLDDHAWHTVLLPHDWSIEGPFSQEWASATAFLPGGVGWYRKSFEVPAEMRGKKVFVYFDGVYKNSEVWLNGHSLGKRPSGFASFEYELTPYLNSNGKNLLAVKAEHSQVADSRWYTGSGIYRNVYLVGTAPVHVARWGVGFTTPEVTAAAATGQVTVAVTNASTTATPVLVKAILADAKGKVVATMQQQVQAQPGTDTPAALTLKINKPTLWSVENPNLYKLRVALSVQGKPVDGVEEEVGVRTIRFDAAQGFFLNGKNLKLKGVCLHDDAGALGVAVPLEVWERRLKALKEVGCNSIRMSHNPHADYFYTLCDRMGFLVMDEAFDEWEVGKNKWVEGWNVGTPAKFGSHEHFQEWADRDLRDMILRNRNRPSIIMWSIGNEIDYPNDPYSHEVLNTGRNPQIYGKGYLPDHPPASRLGVLARHLVEVAKQYDTSRPITAALAGVVMSNFTDYPDVLDVVGYNYQEFRYPEDHQKYPNRIIYGSENGMGRDAWAAVDSNAYISAQYLWTGIDYLGEAGKWPQRSNGAGLLDMAGFPKPEYYFRQSLWTTKPMTYVAVAPAPKAGDSPNVNHRRIQPTWNWPAGEQVRVVGFTNCEAAELVLNGKSLGRKTGREVYWDVPYQPGTLLLKGYNQGKEVSRTELHTATAPHALQATAYQTKLAASTHELAQMEVRVVDQSGNLVQDATHEISVSVQGPGRVVGIESGDLASHEDYQAPKHRAYHGKLLVFVQPTGAGRISVQMQAPGLQSQQVTLQAK
ncbi:glycoside hydrolase family 2 protein [Hymenobacter sp. NBH84]|uniref:sugar-binding domain-containing protein n=1 Tax=Hymenobacter sp. NBH84 TaxID=2596915 RepID=UPI00162A099A|nr:sugar-binding domain-containing protein [Hymenobacter sp. NBH84]QNE40012.1 glycoside hydrolase family 2 protein [Hymenobacter sp. NBH84]